MATSTVTTTTRRMNSAKYEDVNHIPETTEQYSARSSFDKLPKVIRDILSATGISESDQLKYGEKLESNGRDTIELLRKLNESKLEKLGITKPAHQEALLDAIRDYKQLARSGVSSVSPKQQKTMHARLSSGPSPARVPSPAGVTSLVDSYWNITAENGCLPSVHFALNENGEWWGGKFDSPLDEIENVVENLPELIQNDQVVDVIDNLKRIDLYYSMNQKMNYEVELSRTSGPTHSFNCPGAQAVNVYVLNNDVDRERAFSLYSFLANAYVFSKTKKGNTSVVLPANIAQPLVRLALGVGRQPICDYACTVLDNWILEDVGKGFQMDNIKVLRTFTGSVAEKWFFAIHAAIEQRGGRALMGIKNAQDHIARILLLRKLQGLGEGASKRGVALQSLLKYSKAHSVMHEPDKNGHGLNQSESDFSKAALECAQSVAVSLEDIANSFKDICEIMFQLPDYCPPEIFFDEVRPWLGSWPEGGVCYASFCTCGYVKNDIFVKYSGASGAQSSLLPSVDGFLGIAYGQRQNIESTSAAARTDLGAFIRQLQSFRASMPPSHRNFVARVETSTNNVRDLITVLDEFVVVHSGLHTELELGVKQLKLQYNACIEILVTFRRTHSDYATKFIKAMASRRTTEHSPVAAAAPAANKGTGGSDFAVHLSRHVTDTKKSLYKV